MEKKLDRKKIGINLLLIGILTFIVMKTVFKGEDIRSIHGLFKSIENKYIFLGIGFSLLFIMGEALNLYELMRTLGYRPSLVATIKYSFTGFFFSSITPSATGGQPMQIYAMSKDGVSVSHSSLMLLIELMIYQLVTFLYGLVACICFRNSEIFQAGKFIYFVGIGLILNGIGVTFFGLLVFNERLTDLLYRLFKFIVDHLGFIKEEKRENAKVKLDSIIRDYQSSSDFMKNNKRTLMRVFLITIVQLGASFSISYVIYRSLGNTKLSYLDLVLVQALIYIGSSFVPLPGSIGVTEKNSLSVFKFLYREELIVSATILSRGISFYSLVLISGISLILYKLRDMKKLISLN